MTPRPRALTPEELGFVRRPRVPWLSPLLLLATAVRVVLAKLLGAYLDKRELQHQFPQDVFDHSGGELWLDYVADLGDGFDSTYTVAYLVSQPDLVVDGRRLPRGSVLVMGGDQVYPTASWQDYEDRCKGPYQAALPEGTENLYALPGNHDWYDGLTAFLRMFGHRRSIGGRCTNQRRSYFALNLPGKWWLYAVDVQEEAYLDDPQLDYFERAAGQLEEGDKVIICVARPFWVISADDPRAFEPVDYLIRTVIDPTGATVPLMLTGDLHHYSRYASTDDERQLVTCGGGGAYLAPTDTLPSTLEVPPPRTTVRHASPSMVFNRKQTYPSARESRAWALGIFWRLPLRNPGFAAVLGALHFGLLLALLAAPYTMVGAAVVMYSVAFAFSRPSQGPYRVKNLVAAFLHGSAHLGFAIVCSLVWRSLHLDPWLLFLDLPVAVVGGTVLVTLFLYLAGSLGVNDNELFAGQGIEHVKSFLRLRITPEGELTMYAVAIPRVNRGWRANPEGVPESSWIVPEKEIAVRLIEPPLTM